MEDSNDEENIQEEVNRFIVLANSIVAVNRQTAGRTVLETLRHVVSKPSAVAVVLQHLAIIAVDVELEVRVSSLEYIPHIALVLSDPSYTNEALRDLITTHVLPIIVTALMDAHIKVMKLADSSLIALLEHCLIPNACVKETVWPALVKRMDLSPCVESSVRVISMMSKMVPWVGCDTTETLFVPLFNEMCSSPEFLVRKACATIIGDFCAVVSLDTVETHLIPRFVELCKDRMWGVRQICAEVFISVSSACSPESRRDTLTPIFISLVEDPIKVVQLAAFQSLGPFISTFAYPSVTSLVYNHHGELVLKSLYGFEFMLNNGSSTDSGRPLEANPIGGMDSFVDYDRNRFRRDALFSIDKWNLGHIELNSEEPAADEHCKETKDFISTTYWRDPIPEIDLDPEILNSVKKEWSRNNYSHEKCCETSGINSLDSKIAEMKVYDDKMKQMQDKQTIVPSELIECFTSMSVYDCIGNASNEEKVRSELAHHCAYNLPAVAITLGARYWPLLKDTYEKLAADEHWKVRRIVAYSIHELALIVGDEVATRDLVPVFNALIKDLDEVRIGALKNLATFLRFLKPAGRNSFLPKLGDFLVTDYGWNWRFRAELAGQLMQVMGIFSPQDTSEYLTPVVFSLLYDHVAEVRLIAQKLVTGVITVVSVDASLVRRVVCELAEQFAHSGKWVRRQTFAQLCARLVQNEALPKELFARDILPHLLDLSWDKVPNVRLAVARTLSQSIMVLDFFSNAQSPHYEVLLITLKRLQSDKDRDVRDLAQLPSGTIVQTPLRGLRRMKKRFFYNVGLKRPERENERDIGKEEETEEALKHLDNGLR